MFARCISVTTIWTNKYSNTFWYLPAIFVLMEESGVLRWRLLALVGDKLSGTQTKALVDAYQYSQAFGIEYIPDVDDGDEYDEPKHYTGKSLQEKPIPLGSATVPEERTPTPEEA